jgi:hypothetical protein
MLRRMRRLVSVALLAGSASCGGLLGIQELHVDTDDAGGADDGGSLEAAPAAEGASPNALGPWCSANAATSTFCDDFSGPALTAGWQVEVTARGGTGLLDSSVVKSPPSAFTVVVDPTAGEGAGFALAKTFPAGNATASFTLGFDLRVDDLRSGNTGVTITLARVAFASSYALELVLRSDGAVLVEHPASGAAVEHALKVKLTAMVWSRVEFDLGASGSVGLKLDGADALGTSFSSASSASGEVTVHVGAPAAAGAMATRIVHFDDVVVDLR